ALRQRVLEHAAQPLRVALHHLLDGKPDRTGSQPGQLAVELRPTLPLQGGNEIARIAATAAEFELGRDAAGRSGLAARRPPQCLQSAIGELEGALDLGAAGTWLDVERDAGATTEGCPFDGAGAELALLEVEVERGVLEPHAVAQGQTLYAKHHVRIEAG